MTADLNTSGPAPGRELSIAGLWQIAGFTNLPMST